MLPMGRTAVADAAAHATGKHKSTARCGKMLWAAIGGELHREGGRALEQREDGLAGCAVRLGRAGPLRDLRRPWISVIPATKARDHRETHILHGATCRTVSTVANRPSAKPFRQSENTERPPWMLRRVWAEREGGQQRQRQR